MERREEKMRKAAATTAEDEEKFIYLYLLYDELGSGATRQFD